MINTVTNNSVTITMTLPVNYGTLASESTSIVVKAPNGIENRYNTIVTNATNTTTGLVTTAENAVACTTDGYYSFKVIKEGTSDLDIEGVTLELIGAGMFSKVTALTTINI